MALEEIRESGLLRAKHHLRIAIEDALSEDPYLEDMHNHGIAKHLADVYNCPNLIKEIEEIVIQIRKGAPAPVLEFNGVMKLFDLRIEIRGSSYKLTRTQFNVVRYVMDQYLEGRRKIHKSKILEKVSPGDQEKDKHVTIQKKYFQNKEDLYRLIFRSGEVGYCILNI